MARGGHTRRRHGDTSLGPGRVPNPRGRYLTLLADEGALASRGAALTAPHVAPIELWRTAAARADRPIPHPDPFDGGVAARLLLVLETPGPGREPLRFVSRDNPTGTGRNLRRFLDAAGLAREDVVIWNAVPWVVHLPGARNRALRVGEVREGLAMLPGFLSLLPRLRAVVLAGRVAGLAEPVVNAARAGLPVLRMPHPSPTIVCTSPAIATRIAVALGAAAALVGDDHVQ